MSAQCPTGGVPSSSHPARPAKSGPLVFAAAVVLLIAASRAQGGVYYWSTPSGDWSMASNWGGTVPTWADDAYVINGGTASVTLFTPVCQNLFLGDPKSGGSGTLQLSSGALSALNNEYVGNLGGGTFNQAGGMNNIYGNGYGGNGYVGWLVLGNGAGSSGAYNLSGSGALNAGTLVVGGSGSGGFTQFGGASSVNVSQGTLGQNAGSSGVCNLSAGLFAVDNLSVGGFGAGASFNRAAPTAASTSTSATGPVPAAATASAARATSR